MQKFYRCSVFLSLVVISGLVSPCFCDGAEGDGIKAPEEEQYYTLEKSLIDLKRQAEDIVADNEKILSKIRNLRERIPGLQGQLGQTETERQDLIRKNREVRGALEAEVRETNLAEGQRGDLEREYARGEAEELGIQGRVEEKERIKASWEERLAALQEQIADLKKRFVNREDPQAESLKREKDNLSRSLSEREAALREKKREGEKIQKIFADDDSELKKVQAAAAELQKSLAVSRDAFQEAAATEREIRAEAALARTQEGQRIDSLIEEIKALERYADDLDRVVKDSSALRALSLKQFDKERSDRLEAIHHLEKMNLSLGVTEASLKKLLDGYLNLRDERYQDQQVQGELKDGEARLAGLIEAQSVVSKNIDSKKNTQKILEKSFGQLQKELYPLQEKIKAARKAKVPTTGEEAARLTKLIQEKQTRLEKSRSALSSIQDGLPKPVKESEDLRIKRAVLKRRVSNAESELQLIGQQGKRKDVPQEKLERNSLARINKEVREMETYYDELVSLMDAVKQKYNTDAMDVLKYEIDKKQLTEHVGVLKAENQHLQREVLTLMVTIDKLGVEAGH
ncbi:MAG: hypothetical protein WC552_07200 [Candidatus Omnitrophota bacterium]